MLLKEREISEICKILIYRKPLLDIMKCGVPYEAWTFFQSLLIIKVVLGVEKHWLPNLEWETAENWIGKRIPELDSYVTFPLDMRHAVGIGKSIDLRLSGIDLPRSGSLVLPSNGKLQVGIKKHV